MSERFKGVGRMNAKERRRDLRQKKFAGEAGCDVSERRPLANGRWVELSLTEMAMLDSLIAGDEFGQVWNADRSRCQVYESAATGYTEPELAGLLGIPVGELAVYLDRNWREHGIAEILAGDETVKFHGEGVLLWIPDTVGLGYQCRLFTPTPNWKPGATEEVGALEALAQLA